MIKTTFIPDSKSFNLQVDFPNDYLGKKVNCIMFIDDEFNDLSLSNSKKPSDFFGTLSKEDGEKFHIYLKESRENWERNF